MLEKVNFRDFYMLLTDIYFADDDYFRARFSRRFFPAYNRYGLFCVAKRTKNMIDKYKKVIGFLILVIAAIISFYAVRTFYPEFYHQIIHLTMAGDVDGLGDYISSFGYGAFLVSIGLLIFCNVFGIPTIPFLTVNGALFGLLPGILISWAGEVIGIEISFHIGRIFFRKEARRLIEKKHMLTKLDKYSCVEHMAMARAIPYSPNILFTALAVLTKLTGREHLKATLIGKIPSVVVEVWLGHDLIYFSEHGIRFLVLLFLLIAGCVIRKMYKKHCFFNNRCL